MSTKRFIVSIYHGEGGSIANVFDTQTEDCLGYYSTIRNGASWRTLAEAHANLLNDKHKPAAKRRHLTRTTNSL